MPAAKGIHYDCYCGYQTESGQVAQYGSPFKVGPGDPMPETGPGAGLMPWDCAQMCAPGACGGPLAPILKALMDTLFSAYRPKITPEMVERQRQRFAQRGSRLGPRPPRPRRLWSDPPKITSSYCCICGSAEGGCYVSGLDCRLLPVLQRSKGQC